MYSQGEGKDEPIGQVNIGLQEGTEIKEQWYRLQDKMDQDVVGADGRHSLIQLDMSYSKPSPANHGPPLPNSIPIIAKASPVGVTRRARPPTPATSPQGQHSLQAMQQEASTSSPLNIEVTLDMDYKSVVGSQDAFTFEISNDLARAVRGFPDKVHVLGMRQGSVIVEAQLLPGLCPDGRNSLQALDSLQNQVEDRRSLLRQGKFTRHVVRIRQMPEDEDVVDNDLDDCIMDIPLQIDSDSPSYEPIGIQTWFPALSTRAATPPPRPSLESVPSPPPRPSIQHTPQHAQQHVAQHAPQSPDHFHPGYIHMSGTPRFTSITAPTSPPLITDPRHDPRQAYPNPFMYPNNRGLAAHQPSQHLSPTPAPHQSQQQQQQQQQQMYLSNPMAQMQEHPQEQAWLPMPNTWYGRYKQRRNEAKDIKLRQREEAMERLRQTERRRTSNSPHGRAGVVSQLWTMLSPPRNALPHPAAIHPIISHTPPGMSAQRAPHNASAYNGSVHSGSVQSPNNYQPRRMHSPNNYQPNNKQPRIVSPSLVQQSHVQHNASVHNGSVQSPNNYHQPPIILPNLMPVPRLKQQQQAPQGKSSQYTPPQQPQRPQMERYGAPKEFGWPEVEQRSRQDVSRRQEVWPQDSAEQSELRERKVGRDRVADWLGNAMAPSQQQAVATALVSGHRPPLMDGRPKMMTDNPHMPRAMEPSILDVYAGTGTVRFHAGVNNYYGSGTRMPKRCEAFSGHNTPNREYGTFSPVALSAMTAPTPRVNSSMWSTWEMAIGDIPQEAPAFPLGYDPSKPYSHHAPPAGAFHVRPQEVFANSVASPLPSINVYMQNRGGDVVIQPSRTLVRAVPQLMPRGVSRECHVYTHTYAHVYTSICTHIPCIHTHIST